MINCGNLHGFILERRSTTYSVLEKGSHLNRYPRTNYTKQGLIKKLNELKLGIYQDWMDEIDIIQHLGMDIIYDAGKERYIYKKN
jgi:hypothetical protein